MEHKTVSKDDKKAVWLLNYKATVDIGRSHYLQINNIHLDKTIIPDPNLVEVILTILESPEDLIQVDVLFSLNLRGVQGHTEF